MTDTFYILVEHGEGVAVGDRLDDPNLLAVTDPRRIPVGQVIFDETLYIPDMVMDRAEARLVRAVPDGAARVPEGWGDEQWREADAWTVQAVEPLTAMFGPQADQLVTAIIKAEKYVIDEEGDGDLAERYADAVDAQYHRDPTIVPGWKAEGAANAARDALIKAGTDGRWWAEDGFSCGYGTEMLALAARDLIGTTPEWTREAYEMLTGPWQSAFGPIHPEDAPA